jgi:hypothetical protein
MNRGEWWIEIESESDDWDLFVFPLLSSKHFEC